MTYFIWMMWDVLVLISNLHGLKMIDSTLKVNLYCTPLALGTLLLLNTKDCDSGNLENDAERCVIR